MKRQTSALRFAICVSDGGYVDDLKERTLYQVLPDESAARSKYLRIIDETGEDYLYPAACFVMIEVPREVKRAFTIVKQSTKLRGEVKRKRRSSSAKQGAAA